MLKAFGYIYLRWMLTAFFLIPVVVLLPVFLEVWKFVANIHPALEPFEALAIVPVLLLLVNNYWLAGKMAAKIVFEDMPFEKAFKATYEDLRFNLRFVPFIGRWF